MRAAELRSGKSHGDENFPVASLLLAAEHRKPILAFYHFARAADDVADHPSLITTGPRSAEKKKPGPMGPRLMERSRIEPKPRSDRG